MAFLDNSGDIILDAVLTEVGRRRMAQGNFKITKFAIGDDEIDYGLYQINTGSAYTDLEILQTPIFEAFTSTNANINYGLISNARTDLLYMPVIKDNTKVSSALLTTSSMYHLAVNTETYNKLAASPSPGTGFADPDYILQSNMSSRTKLIFESGIDNSDVTGDASTRASYIISNNLLDNNFRVYIDNRFIIGMLSQPATSYFKNTSAGVEQVNFGALNGVTAASTTPSLDNYSTYSIKGTPNLVKEPTSGTSTASDISVIAGPRGTVAAVNFTVLSELATAAGGTRSSKYTLFGETGKSLFSSKATDLYDYIDTTVYIVGAASAATLQIPLRIIRYAGT